MDSWHEVHSHSGLVQEECSLLSRFNLRKDLGVIVNRQKAAADFR